MSDKKISELTNITGANLADADEFVVVDTSASETKAITYGELKKFTGTVTADGLTISTTGTVGASFTTAAYGYIDLSDGVSKVRIQNNNNIPRIGSGSNHPFVLASNEVQRIKLDTNGDISFYEDTGTTPKFFWDASAESLGLGSTSPDSGRKLHIEGGDTTVGITLKDTAGSQYGITSDNNVFTIRNDGLASDRLVINSSGNVGIGTSSPVSIGGYTIITLNNSGSGSALYLQQAGATKGRVITTANELTVDTTAAIPLVFGTNSAERMRITSTGHVNINGTANGGLGSFTLGNTSASREDITLLTATTAFSNINFADGITGADRYRGAIGYNHASDHMAFSTASTERMRIDSSGNLMVGTTSNVVNSVSGGQDGFYYQSGDYLAIARDSGQPLYLNRLTNDGELLQFRKDGTTVGSIGVSGSYVTLDSGTGYNVVLYREGAPRYVVGNNTFFPHHDNLRNLGALSNRWDDVYATNALIQTSDRNEKQDIAELDEAERRVAVAAKGLLRKFRWKDAVAEKGDDARIHFGIIAQDLQAAFAAEGLDAGKYAMFIHSTWTDEETGEERSRMGVRYSELLAFIIAAL